MIATQNSSPASASMGHSGNNKLSYINRLPQLYGQNGPLAYGNDRAIVNYNDMNPHLISFPVSRKPITGEQIDKLRLDAGLKQTVLPEALGIHEFTVVNWERGYTKPCANDLQILAKYFDGDI